MKKIILIFLNIIVIISYFLNIKQVKEIEASEDYLVSVVACEMPVLYGIEALKAQAIASRTYAMYKTTLTNDDQCTISDEELRNRWQDKYDEYKSIVIEAVNSTNNIVITKEGKMFLTYYFSTSNGYTENSLTVFNQSGIESVNSEWDKNSNNYKKTITYTKSELVDILGTFNEIKIVSRNNTNHVEKVLVDNQEYTGIEFRKLLNLRSTDFEINTNNDEYVITTYGYGHGVGMSQYGAYYLSTIGYTYEEILKYYYGDIELIKI
jgi:stage II sporulation protein D